MDTGDNTVDITVMRLDVVGGMAVVGPGQGAAIGLEHAVAVADGEEGGRVRALGHVREADAQDDLNLLTDDEVADEQPQDARHPYCSRDRREWLDFELRGVLDLDVDLAGYRVEQLAQLAGHVVGDLLRALDEVEVAAAGIGDGGQECLVEVLSDAEGAGADARRTQVGRIRGQRGRIDEADVGQLIGQEQAAVDAVGGEVSLERVGSGGPAAVQVGAAACVDVLERSSAFVLFAVVARQEPTTVSTWSSYRPGAVENKGDVDGGPFWLSCGALFRRGGLDEDVAGGACLGADKGAVGAGGERGHSGGASFRRSGWCRHRLRRRRAATRAP